ncbi:alcohol dehydrogenase [Cohnella kolymensis]|uniref:Alcohol dehydrogenase n=1 Tax=Cohnella kolymensis TaxID=1590652 RepID=A0ABR5A351_9BACL|nr:zinc-binding dehydrogenase [Cohnella kolymensis]KIL35469.1 alcohol dehydrogenase [Cohnella kolymensis]
MTTGVLSAVAKEPGRIEIREFPFPNITLDSALLRVEIVGVCGTDVTYYNKSPVQRVLGHHVVGFIEKIGEVASARWGVQEGDRVALEEYIPCGHCHLCRMGEFRLCALTDPRIGGLRYGVTPISVEPSLWGGFSQHMYLHPNTVLHRMPDHVPAVEAALTLPLANGFEWMCIQGGVGPGKTVVIQGPGQQGLACSLAAKAAGADTVIVTGLSSSAKRLELAKQLGADYTINIETENLVTRVNEITGGKMADVVIDTSSGGGELILSCMAVAATGAIVIFSDYKYQKTDQFDIDMVISKTLRLQGVRGHSYKSVEMAVECIAAGKFPLKIMNSHNYNLLETDQALKTAGGQGAPSPLLVTVSPWN